MYLRVMRNKLTIIPDREDERDIVYIEEILGLREEGDTVICRRVNATGLSCLAYLEIAKEKK